MASLATYLMAQNLDHFLFNTLKKKFNDHGMAIRYCLSTALSQLFDTIVFSFLGLYGLVHNIGHLIIVSYTIKILVIMLSTPFAWSSSYIVKGRTP